MAQVLYRKYRSKKLSEIVGQPHITKTLSEALKSGHIAHAYLFTGPRGVGKTSVARILAHEVNKLPYTDDQPHIDIIEIDAASNRRIDEIRDLREKVHTLPASADYKVYIIDEVHMLTKEAFNALLKTLEEPPAHVIFILATTDPHKLPDTIISRTQRFSFKPIDNSHAVEHLKAIAKSEAIKVQDKALELIAEHGEGSFRDSISLLDQLGHGSKEITADDVRLILGMPSLEAIGTLTKLIDDPSTTYKQLANQLNDLLNQGYSASLLAKRLMNELRDKLVNDQLKMSPDKTMELLKGLLNVDSANDSNTFLLLTLLNAIDPKPVAISQPTATKQTAVKPDQPKTTKSVKQPNIWPEVLNELKNNHNTLYGIIRMAQPVFKDNNQLNLSFDFAFHKKQVSEAKNRELITGIIKALTGQEYTIKCLLSEPSSKSEGRSSAVGQPSKDMANISKIFGGGELVD